MTLYEIMRLNKAINECDPTVMIAVKHDKSFTNTKALEKAIRNGDLDAGKKYVLFPSSQVLIGIENTKIKVEKRK